MNITKNRKDRSNNIMSTNGEIFMVPFFGQGHLFPCMELCKHISSRNYKTTLIISLNLASSVPSALRQHPLIEIVELPDASPAPESSGPGFGPGRNPFSHRHQQMGRDIEDFLSARPNGMPRPVCAVIDVMMGEIRESFAKFGIPTVSFFTSGAASSAMQCAAWRAGVGDMKPGEIRSLPGLPVDMAVTYADIKRRPRGGLHGPGLDGEPPGPGGPNGSPPGGPFGSPPGPGGPFGSPPKSGDPDGSTRGKRSGPPVPGGQPPWWDEVDGSIALLINTCDDIERTFVEYVGKQTGKPVWGVGPLLPEQYWKPAGSILRDRDIRPNKKSNYTEDEVIQWLDSKPRSSVVYVSFGSEVGPTLEEYDQLADALAESNHPFIWVIQPGSGKPGPPRAFFGDKKDENEEEAVEEEKGYYPNGLENKVGEKGMIICGWAPQLMILSHPSTGGFLSHCGWNSTTEAIGKRVPLLAWPIRGDQFYNAKLAVTHLKIGHMITYGDLSDGVKKEDIVNGIERLMRDQVVHKCAEALGSKFEGGFPASSLSALDDFMDFVIRQSVA